MIQIAAGTLDAPSSSFCCCILPEQDIPGDVTALTGFAKDGGALTLRGQRVDTITRAAAVQGLLHYLRQVRDARGARPILVAHYAIFDAEFLHKLVAGEGEVAALDGLVLGFADTLPAFQAALPRRPRVRGSFKLGTLAADFGVSG